MTLKVLHIEDQAQNRLLVRKVMEADGHEVLEAPDGLTGVQLAGAVHPDLILVDINIPGLTGYEVVTRLRSEAHLTDVPMVAITAEGDRDHALALGFDGFISKPIRLGTFVQQLQAFVDGHRESVSEAIRVNHLRDHSRQVVDRLESRLRELEELNASLQQAEKLKTTVLRNVSHELSTPLTPLVGYIRILANEELGPLNANQLDILKQMDASSQRLKTVIDNLLNATRFAAGLNAITRSVARPSDIMAQVLKRVQEFSQSLNVEVVTDASQDVNGIVLLVDEARIVEAIYHIVHNAIRFGPRDGVVRLEFSLGGKKNAIEPHLIVQVTDEGPGIPKNMQERVIEPFYQCDGSATRSHGGMGLGLTIAHSTIVAHGGELEIFDMDEGGTRILMRIPNAPLNGGLR